MGDSITNLPIYRAKKISSKPHVVYGYCEGWVSSEYVEGFLNENMSGRLVIENERVYAIDPSTIEISFDNGKNFDSFSFVTRAIEDHREGVTIEICTVCKSDKLSKKLLKDRVWMGTKKLPSEFFRRSEYDFGWDYYADGDILQTICECGHSMYKKATGIQE